MNLAKTWQLTGQFVASTPGSFKEHSAWYLRFARENNIYHYHIRYSQTGEKFRETVNQTGFVTDDNRREIDKFCIYMVYLAGGLNLRSGQFILFTRTTNSTALKIG